MKLLALGGSKFLKCTSLSSGWKWDPRTTRNKGRTLGNPEPSLGRMSFVLYQRQDVHALSAYGVSGARVVVPALAFSIPLWQRRLVTVCIVENVDPGMHAYSQGLGHGD